MDLLSLTQAEAQKLTNRGFALIDKVNALILPLVFPNGAADLRLSWNELRTLMLSYREEPTPREARVRKNGIGTGHKVAKNKRDALLVLGCGF